MKHPFASAGLVVLLVAAAVWAAPGSPSGVAQARDKNQGASKDPATSVVYACPMHPEVTSDRPGKCPKCGMFLEAKPMDATYYTCPMHPDVKLAAPGKCPKCGMNLEKKAERVSYVYTCPMHPEVKSDKAGKCPECGMLLEARPVATTAGESPKNSAGHGH